MAKNDLRVFPKANGTWVMRRDGASRALSTHETKRAALDAARLRAARDGVDVSIQNRRGWVIDYDTRPLAHLAPWRPGDDLITLLRTRAC